MLTRTEAMAVAVERALMKDYFVALPSPEAASLKRAPNHLRWHGPLWIDCAGDGALLNKRIEVAGEIFSGCFDISSNNLLMITNRILGSSYVYQRAQGPRGRILALGPIDAVLVVQGNTFGPNPLVYVERREPLSLGETESLQRDEA